MNKKGFRVNQKSIAYERWRYFIESRHLILLFSIVFSAILFFSNYFRPTFFLFALATGPILWASYFFTVCDAMKYASVCVAIYLVLMMGAVHLDRHNGFELAITNLFPAAMLGMILCFFVYVDILKKDTFQKTK